jgi:hypothetical protein
MVVRRLAPPNQSWPSNVMLRTALGADVCTERCGERKGPALYTATRRCALRWTLEGRAGALQEG